MVDEKTALLETNTRRLLESKGIADDLIPLSEGACFFLLGPADEVKDAQYGALEFKTLSAQELQQAEQPEHNFVLPDHCAD